MAKRRNVVFPTNGFSLKTDLSGFRYSLNFKIMKQPLLFLLLLLAAYPAYPQSDGIRQKNFNVKKNIALQGYDPVSYFSGKPLEGDDMNSFK